jgi:acyl carrier protein phosphodiesterase
MDFMLSKYWNEYHPESLEDFCNHTYKVVAALLPEIPLRLHMRIQRMMSHRWLESCANRERMKATLTMLSQRASFENNIPAAMATYTEHEELMDSLFKTFFKELQEEVILRNED